MSCPICGKDVDAKYRPFCSRHCADVDLGRWLKGGYSVPSTDPEDIEEALDALEKGLGEEGAEPGFGTRGKPH
ncbi:MULTISPECIES: DNA gyrase inhibitor YacG [Rhodobacterales]|uniref:DNA gyrase inhibitor YacG n=1 Tax=Rhodobacterales TaxID=204455 RepID=UPI001C93AB1B|nr:MULTISPECIES: DNA gyrase inhibitor YacG [Rhodobacterales]MBY6091863.1 DNA gyrase inhibitor YacG [Maritimibacter alkaliphilus]MCA0919236.1 DNA gyrase inhibitor YacG [Pseudooceanicola nanhaiensis]